MTNQASGNKTGHCRRHSFQARKPASGAVSSTVPVMPAQLGIFSPDRARRVGPSDHCQYVHRVPSMEASKCPK